MKSGMRVLTCVACATLLLVAFAAPTPGLAQDDAKAPTDGHSSDEAQANNPLANFVAFNIHNYYIPSLSGLDDQNANTAWVRYAQPFKLFGRPWLMRASLPFARVPTGPGTTTSGLGDFNLNLFYLFDTRPGTSFGVGPQLTFPTASENQTGADKLQAGVSVVYFNTTSPTFQWGGLLTWQGDVAGDSDAPGTSSLALQPFYIWQLGKGLYLRGAPIWAFDLKNDNYHVPIALGIGQVIKRDNAVFNFFIEPQYTILDRGPGQPELQFFVAVNMQFK